MPQLETRSSSNCKSSNTIVNINGSMIPPTPRFITQDDSSKNRSNTTTTTATSNSKTNGNITMSITLTAPAPVIGTTETALSSPPSLVQLPEHGRQCRNRNPVPPSPVKRLKDCFSQARSVVQSLQQGVQVAGVPLIRESLRQVVTSARNGRPLGFRSLCRPLNIPLPPRAFTGKPPSPLSVPTSASSAAGQPESIQIRLGGTTGGRRMKVLGTFWGLFLADWQEWKGMHVVTASQQKRFEGLIQQVPLHMLLGILRDATLRLAWVSEVALLLYQHGLFSRSEKNEDREVGSPPEENNTRDTSFRVVHGAISKRQMLPRACSRAVPPEKGLKTLLLRACGILLV